MNIIKTLLFVLMLSTSLFSIEKDDEVLANTMWTCSQYDITVDRIITVGLFFTKDKDEQIVTISNSTYSSANYKDGIIYGYKDGDSTKNGRQNIGMYKLKSSKSLKLSLIDYTFNFNCHLKKL